MANHKAVLRAYIGTYTQGDSVGIYHGFFDPETGRLELTGSIGDIQNPSFLALDTVRCRLYAVSEVNDFNGLPTGGVYAYALDEQSGQPSLLNSQPSGGTGPCHLCVDRDGRFVLIANYDGGSVALLPISADGRLREASAVIAHHGTGPDLTRQDRPHAHSVRLDPANRYVLSADLGTDRLYVYEPDIEAGTLAAHDPPSVSTPGGSGPRHFVFHPSGQFLYSNTEMASTIIVWAYDGTLGTLREMQTISMLPDSFSGKSAASGIQIHPAGKFLYSANRGPDSIAIFAVDSETGRLTAQGHVPSGGKNPRDLTIDPTGRCLLAAHQDSGTLVSFHIDPQTGALTPTGQSAEVPAAACVVFLASA